MSLRFSRLVDKMLGTRTYSIWVQSIADGQLYNSPSDDPAWLRSLIGEFYLWSHLVDWEAEVETFETTELEGREYLVVRYAASYHAAGNAKPTFERGLIYMTKPACPMWDGLVLFCFIDVDYAAPTKGAFPAPGVEPEFMDVVRSMEIE